MYYISLQFQPFMPGFLKKLKPFKRLGIVYAKKAEGLKPADTSPSTCSKGSDMGKTGQGGKKFCSSYQRIPPSFNTVRRETPTLLCLPILIKGSGCFGLCSLRRKSFLLRSKCPLQDKRHTNKNKTFSFTFKQDKITQPTCREKLYR